jgi:hypothetical protein
MGNYQASACHRWGPSECKAGGDICRGVRRSLRGGRNDIATNWVKRPWAEADGPCPRAPAQGQTRLGSKHSQSKCSPAMQQSFHKKLCEKDLVIVVKGNSPSFWSNSRSKCPDLWLKPDMEMNARLSSAHLVRSAIGYFTGLNLSNRKTAERLRHQPRKHCIAGFLCRRLNPLIRPLLKRWVLI